MADRHLVPLASLIRSVVLLGLVLPGFVSAQTDIPAPSQGNVEFTADLGTVFRNGSILARVYLELPYESLRFSRTAAGWSAVTDITVIAYEKGDQQLDGDLWTVPLNLSFDPAAGQHPNLAYRRRFDLKVVSGKVKFEIRVTQPSSGREGVWTYPLDIPRYETRPVSISDFVFGKCVTDSTPPDTAWGDPEFSPWPRRRYGNEHPLLCVQGEIYDHLDLPDTTYRLSWEVQNGTGHKVDSWTEEVPRVNGRGNYILHPSIAALSLGSYKVRVDVSFGGEKARRERFFEMDESRVDIFENPRMIRVVLGYVARNEELLRLEDLPEDSLQTFWNEFWLSRDPTPATPRNERLTEFLRRLEYANSHYSVLEPGWSSDMGRIYIRYGAPDDIDRASYSNAGPPREVWYYTGRGLRFVFLDTEGFGRFRLAGTMRQ